MIKQDEKTVLARRNVIKALGAGFATGGLLLAGCKQEAPPAAAQAAPPAVPKPAATPEPLAAAPAGAEAKPADGETLNCKDKAPIDDTSKQMRRALQYKEKSDTPDKLCKGCAQFEAGKYGACGGCKLITGAINPLGICLSYAPLQAAPAKPN